MTRRYHITKIHYQSILVDGRANSEITQVNTTHYKTNERTDQDMSQFYRCHIWLQISAFNF